MTDESTRHAVHKEKPPIFPSQSLRAKKLTDWAKALDEARYVYALYGALDGLSLSYSMFKYLFDLMYSNYSSQILHQWMKTPEGALAAGSESLAIIAFSLMGNLFKDDDPNAFKRYIAIVWPYCRDTVKGLKNGYKGVRGALQMTSFISGTNLNDMIVPVGLGLGVLAVLNRMLMRYMVSGRKRMMKQNAQLLHSIQISEPFEIKNLNELPYIIGKQSDATRRFALLGAFCGGVVDSLYLYMGVLSVVPLSPLLFSCVAAFSVLFTLSNIITRIYEEYDFQRSLVISQKKIELAVLGKGLEKLFIELQEIANESPNQASKSFEASNHERLTAIRQKIQEFSAKQKELHKLVNLSSTSAALSGLKDGLVAYSAISSLVFAGATITTMLSVSFPPFLVLSSVLLGVTSIIGFIAYAIDQNKQRFQEKPEQPMHQKWDGLVNTVNNDIKTVKDLEPEEVKEAIFDGMAVDPSPQYFTQEMWEVCRSFFSGIAKGQKTLDYTCTPWQEIDDNGNYHETTAMLIGTAISATVYSFGLALRAFARGLGRPPLDRVVPPPKPGHIPQSKSMYTIGETQSATTLKTRDRAKSAPPTCGERRIGFFDKGQQARKSPTPPPQATRDSRLGHCTS